LLPSLPSSAARTEQGQEQEQVPAKNWSPGRSFLTKFSTPSPRSSVPWCLVRDSSARPTSIYGGDHYSGVSCAYGNGVVGPAAAMGEPEP